MRQGEIALKLYQRSSFGADTIWWAIRDDELRTRLNPAVVRLAGCATARKR